jgi:Family of unknown function (DUF6350)
MTARLTANRPASRGSTGDGPRRPLAVGAALAGAAAAASVLVAAMAVALAGWFASDAASHGDTRDALRVGADAWLLAHGSRLDLVSAGITLAPLGLTLLCAYVAFRLGRWAACTSAVDDVGTVLLGVVVLAGIYGVVTVLTAVLASTPEAEPHLGRAFCGGFLVALVGGGLGIAAGSGQGEAVWGRLPDAAQAVIRGALACVLLVEAAAAALLAVALLLDLGTAANVLSRLHTDGPGGLLYTVVVAAVTPNAVLLSGSYLLGAGFAVGAGTVVSPTLVTLGPVPAFPLLAALPDGGPTPWWAAALMALPVLLAVLGAFLMVRRHPSPAYEAGAGRGLAAGVLGALLLSLLTRFGGGAVGPGRMADVGALWPGTLVSALLALGGGGLLGGLVATWWVRRGWVDAELPPSRETTRR